MDFQQALAELLAEKTGLAAGDLRPAIETPPDPGMGDFAFPCFLLAKTMRKAPAAVAAELAEGIYGDFIERTEAKGPYLNFFIDRGRFAREVLGTAAEAGARYGASDIGGGRKIVIDYSSPNIAKPFHIGHLRSTVIGNALYHIYEFLGYDCFGINFLGDWGTQFGKLITAYTKWGDRESVIRDDIRELNRLYVKFHSEAENDPSLEDEARAWFLKMQKGDGEALEYWRWFNEISMLEFNRIYDRLGVSFDSNKGESFYNDKMEPVVNELRERGLLVESQGAMVVDLEDYKMPPCLILRSDGGTLYPTRDIASAFYRNGEYGFHKALYITGVDQSLHFAQWFKVVELMGYEWARDLVFVPFGMVSLPTGKMSTRRGQVVFMEDLLDEAVDKIAAIIEEKNPGLNHKADVARQVGIGAIVFNDLYNSRIKEVVFSWEKMLNFEGETGPYAQYTHARCCGILENAQDFNFSGASLDFGLLRDDASFALIKEIYLYPEKIADAAEKNEPFVLTRQLIAICQAFNRFYANNRILDPESGDDIKAARLALVDCVRRILQSGLNLLGIAAPEKM